MMMKLKIEVFLVSSYLYNHWGFLYINGLFIETIIVSHELVQKGNQKVKNATDGVKRFFLHENFHEGNLIWNLEIGK